MNATLCLLTASLLMGADETQPLGEERAPIVETAPTIEPVPYVMPTPIAYQTAGCASCGNACGAGYSPGCADPNPEEKTGLFARIKKRFGRDKKDKIGSRNCGNERPSLFSKLFHRDCGACASNNLPIVSSCASCNTMPAPMVMPEPIDPAPIMPLLETPTPTPVPELSKGEETSPVRTYR